MNRENGANVSQRTRKMGNIKKKSMLACFLFRLIARGFWMIFRMRYIKLTKSNAIREFRGVVKKYPEKTMFINQASGRAWSYTEVRTYHLLTAVKGRVIFDESTKYRIFLRSMNKVTGWPISSSARDIRKGIPSHSSWKTGRNMSSFGRRNLTWQFFPFFAIWKPSSYY